MKVKKWFINNSTITKTYNVAANKVAATAGISMTEGQIMIDTIKAQIPKVITALDQKSIEGTTNGYVVHNSRSGSRRYFQAVLDNQHYKFPITKSQLVEIGNASRNTGIQGSNSDLMKEAIAMIELWKTLYKQDINLLLTVHDEVVYDCPEDKTEFYTDKIKQLMIRAANNYLIKEVRMSVNASYGRTWTK
jgi:DNA polymerase-1